MCTALTALPSVGASAWSPGAIPYPAPALDVVASPGGADAGGPDAAAPDAAAPVVLSHLIPLVPVVSFWSDERSIELSELARLVGVQVPAGPGNRVIAVSAPDVAPLGHLLGVTPTVMALPAAEVKRVVQAMPGAIGIIRADDVTVDVRALAIDGVGLFGTDRTWRLAAWPLLVQEPGVTSSFSVSRTWTLAAGGDVMLDKAVYWQSIRKGQGVNYAWDGGTAAIDRRYCCGWGGKPLVAAHRTGDAGAVGRIFSAADLSIVNLESPEPNRYRYHSGGFVFTGDPVLLDGLRNAGIDVAGLANNHIGNGGAQGILDTINHLDRLGIAHPGAGANSTAARRPAWVTAGGLRIAVLAYVWGYKPSYAATRSRPGAARYSIYTIVRDIRAAKAAGANLVIVMPHWGYEYTEAVAASQRADARAMIDAGADLILGSHSHWVGPFEQIGEGHLAFYSLGDLVFDWTHDERTQEGVIVVLTFSGSRLVQLDLLPTVIIAGQPNLLDPAGDGKAVLDPVRRTSEPRLRW
jgi:poly-gamma-glutamate capsule biosynthesis protein CapA/YwtB (metallophosphatase superfamily)